MKLKIVTFLLTFGLLGSLASSAAEEIDLPPLKVKQLCGQVMVGPSYYAPKAYIELRRNRDVEVITSQIANAKGDFFFQGVKKGHYWLYVRLEGTSIDKVYPVHLTKESKSKTCQPEIEVSVCGLECSYNWIKLRKKRD